jgi:hypothetical protein
MFDVFTEEIEILIKDGIANLYWFRRDLHKAWLRSGVEASVAGRIHTARDTEGRNLTKRRQMDMLYDHLRSADFNRRLEISRNFVRLLIEHQKFTPQDEKHRIERAEHCALKLKEIIRRQAKEQEDKDTVRVRAEKARKESYHDQLMRLKKDFLTYNSLSPQDKGYALEKLFPRLMQTSGIPVHEPFKIVGEQIDGGIKYDGHYYLVELKWTADKVGPKDLGSFYYKADGKLDSRGLMISMSGFTDGVVSGLPRGREIKVMLLDGVHLSNVIFGIYTFAELLEHCISHAAYKAELYCPHAIAE